MGKIELELESLKKRMASAEFEIMKLKSENQELRLDNERIMNQLDVLRNSTLNNETLNKQFYGKNLFGFNKTFSSLSNIDFLGEKSEIKASGKFVNNEEKPVFLEEEGHKHNDSIFNCSSLCMKTINNTNYNLNKNEKELLENKKIVFKTMTGDKYHTENCKHVGRSRMQIFLQEAMKKNLKACKVCAPDLF